MELPFATILKLSGTWIYSQMYNLLSLSLQEFYDNRVSASRQAYFQELAQLEPEIFLSLDIVYLCFIDDMSRIFSSYFINNGN